MAEGRYLDITILKALNSRYKVGIRRRANQQQRKNTNRYYFLFCHTVYFIFSGDHTTGVWVGGSDNGHVGRWAWFPTGNVNIWLNK